KIRNVKVRKGLTPSRTITYNTSFLTQFRWVLKRTFRNLMLNPQTSVAQVLTSPKTNKDSCSLCLRVLVRITPVSFLSFFFFFKATDIILYVMSHNPNQKHSHSAMGMIGGIRL
ncbi:unnamed protein product, partial [Tetraodon nigroviridis]